MPLPNEGEEDDWSNAHSANLRFRNDLHHFFWLVYLLDLDPCKIVIEVSNWSRWGVRFPKVKWIKQSKSHVKLSKSSTQKPQYAESIPRYIQCSIFSSIVFLRFPHIYLISPWFDNIFPFTAVFRLILYYNIDPLSVIHFCSFSFSFCRSWMLLWTYLVARENCPWTMEKAIWEGVA
jgi:hypothetical protein